MTLSLVGYVGSAIYLICNDQARKKVPLNYILLGIVTVSMACFIASFAANLTELSVVTAIMGCCLSTAGLFVAALYTSTRAHMIRNLTTGLIIAMVLDLVVLLMMLSQDKTLVFTISLIILFLLFVLIVYMGDWVWG